MLDISEILDDEDFIQPVTFGILVNGVEQKKTHRTTNVQQASPNTLQRLDVNERSKPYLQVFTKASFHVKNGDYMYFKGKKWRCVIDEDWSDYGYYDTVFVQYSGASAIDSKTPDPYG